MSELIPLHTKFFEFNFFFRILYGFSRQSSSKKKCILKWYPKKSIVTNNLLEVTQKALSTISDLILRKTFFSLEGHRDSWSNLRAFNASASRLQSETDKQFRKECFSCETIWSVGTWSKDSLRIFNWFYFQSSFEKKYENLVQLFI